MRVGVVNEGGGRVERRGRMERRLWLHNKVEILELLIHYNFSFFVSRLLRKFLNRGRKKKQTNNKNVKAIHTFNGEVSAMSPKSYQLLRESENGSNVSDPCIEYDPSEVLLSMVSMDCVSKGIAMSWLGIDKAVGV